MYHLLVKIVEGKNGLYKEVEYKEAYHPRVVTGVGMEHRLYLR